MPRDIGTSIAGPSSLIVGLNLFIFTLQDLWCIIIRLFLHEPTNNDNIFCLQWLEVFLPSELYFYQP